MRKSFDGLMAIIRDTCQMDPFANAVYLFCGRRHNTLKALYFDKDGFVILQKRLDSGRFQWPRNESEVRPLTRQEFRRLMEVFLLTSLKPSATQSGRISDLCRTENLKKLFYCSYPHPSGSIRSYPCIAFPVLGMKWITSPKKLKITAF